ncbi:MAG: hypothetical protein Q9161_001374 [Pseudevernia consocians]
MAQDISGVIPECPANFVAFSTGGVETVLDVQPQMTVNYPNSTIAWFDLGKLHYACSSGTETDLASVPASCNFTITGYGPPPTSQEMAQQTFTYTMDGLIQDMDLTVVSSAFKTLYFVDFVITTTQQLGNAMPAGLMDTVGYTVYSQSPITT